MKIIIRKVEYNTKNGKLIKKTKHGRASGESDYIEDAYGGINSKYPDEEIIPISKEAAREFLFDKKEKNASG